MKTAVVLPRSLGGFLKTLPALASVVGEGRVLGTPAAPAWASLLPLAPGAPRDLGSPLTAAGLRRERVDEVIALTRERSWRIAWAARRAGVPYRRFRPSDHATAPTAAAKVAASANLVIPPELAAVADERLRAAHLDPEREILVGLVPGPERRGGARDVWPWERWAELARSLRRDDPRRRFVLLARPATREDLWPAVRVHEETARRNPLIGPDLDLPTLAAVCSRLSLVVAADSDLPRLARATGAPVLRLQKIEAPTGGDLRRLETDAVREAVAARLSPRTSPPPAPP